MYIDYSQWEKFAYSINTLQLDSSNPRIGYGDSKLNQTEIIKTLIQKDKVYDLAKKISEEGYFVGEEPIICIENNKKVVLEGNRRTAALKLLQNPTKYLKPARANRLLGNIKKNNIDTNQKVMCYIAPNRLLVNPIIYERHNGTTLQKWKTGNQYAFIAEMYYDGGLSVDNICDILNEKKAKIIQQLKAYNLFFEGQKILEKESVYININEFDITNLERFYAYEDARKFLGIDFNNDNGDFDINLPKEEFEKRIFEVFKILIDAERFSRDFNKEDDKKQFMQQLHENPIFDFSAKEEGTTISRAAKKRANLDEEKKKTRKRRKRRKKSKFYDNRIIADDEEIIFNNRKLDTLFEELKSLYPSKVYSFALLLRTYLEQTLYFYIKEKRLLDDLSEKANKSRQEDNLRKVNSLISYIKGTYSIDEEIPPTELMRILRFNSEKNYASATLKVTLDYILKHELKKHLDSNQFKNLKHYIQRIKDGLDLAVHNIETIIDSEHNRRAWQHLKHVFIILSDELNNKD